MPDETTPETTVNEAREAARLTCSAGQDTFATTYRIAAVDSTHLSTDEITIP